MARNSLTEAPVMAFGFYHLACMLLAIYQAVPRFAIRRVSAGAQDTDVRAFFLQTTENDSHSTSQAKVMMHARALCGASKSSLRTVPSLITLCHSTFICESREKGGFKGMRLIILIGGPLMTDPR